MYTVLFEMFNMCLPGYLFLVIYIFTLVALSCVSALGAFELTFSANPWVVPLTQAE